MPDNNISKATDQIISDVPNPIAGGGAAEPPAENALSTKEASQPTPEDELASPLETTAEGQAQIITTTQDSAEKSKISTKRVVVTILTILLLVAGVATGVYLVSQQQEIRTKAGDEGGAETMDTSSVFVQCQKIKAYDSEWKLLSERDLTNLEKDEELRFTLLCTISEGLLDKAKFSINGDISPETINKKPGTDEFYYRYTVKPIDIGSTISIYGWVHDAILDRWF